MDKRPRKELIDGLKEILRDFEEPYDHREWSRFQRQRQGKRRGPIPLFLKLSGIAASLFLMVYASVKLLPLLDGLDKSGREVPNVAASSPAPAAPQRLPDNARPVDTGTHVGDLRPADEPGKGSAPIETLRSAAPSNEIETMSAAEPVAIAPVAVSRQQMATLRGEQLPHTVVSTPLGKQVGRAALPRSRLQPLFIDKEAFGDIQVGFQVNPALTDKGFSIGGGVSAKIAMTKRIAAEIGANYSTMTVGMDTAIEGPIREADYVVGIRNSLGTVAIPIALHYAITDHFSASLGLVPFKVVSDQRTEIRESYRWGRGNVASGDTALRLVGQRLTSRRPDSLYHGNTYWGFVHVTGQLSPALLKRQGIVVAPFLAIPVGGLRDDRYRWLHGGLSFRMYLR